MLSITPSKLEVFRKYIDEEYNGWFTKEMVIEQIKGEQTTTFQANFGTAIHLILEKGYERYYDEKTHRYVVHVKDVEEPFVFQEHELIEVIDYVDRHRNAVNEVPLKHIVKVDHYEVEISMKIDQILGISVTDHKTSEKDFKVDDFERSLQWRIYLLATEAHFFNYNYFKYKKKDEVLTIEREEFSFYPYKNLKEDVIKWVKLFLMFCKDHDLMDYIQKKESKGVV